MAGLSSTGRAWVVAASVGAVEALKDQLGICRWNYPMRSLLHHANARIGAAVSRAKHHQKAVSAPAIAPLVSSTTLRDERAKRTDETLGKVMHLSSWGPH